MTLAQTYGQATLHMGLGRFNFPAANALKCMLVGSTYTPDIDAHDFRSDVTGEVSAVGYTAGGVVLSGVTWTYDAANNWSVLTATSPTWSPMAATVRYAVVYGNTGSAATDPLLGYIDFEENIDLTSQGINLAWPSTGIFRSRLVGA